MIDHVTRMGASVIDAATIGVDLAINVSASKNDAADWEANCEAVSRPSKRLVPIKSIEQQAGDGGHQLVTILCFPIAARAGARAAPRPAIDM